MKRFWARAETRATEAGYAILLDGKPLNLPGGPLIVPFAGLAAAIAAEWADAGGGAEIFTPDDLPLTRLATTALHRVRPHRANIIEQIAAYGANDLLCYHAEARTDLATWQEGVWRPWLDWAEHEFGVRLAITHALVPVTQPRAATEKFRARLETMTDYQLAGLGVIVPLLGSLILSLAVGAGALAPDQACELAQLEELWQEQRWGIDAQALARREKILADIAAAARFMVLCTS